MEKFIDKVHLEANKMVREYNKNLSSDDIIKQE
jgi:hypothetical protein